MDRSIHIPVEFELTEGVRFLAEEFVKDLTGDKAQANAFAMLYAVRLWIDWARQRKIWRPFKGEGADLEFSKDPLSVVIEQACGFVGMPGYLVCAFLNAGVLVKEEKEGLWGFRLVGFEDDNAHLLPGYKTMQQKGGIKKGVRQRMKDVEDAVPQAKKLIEGQGVMLFAKEAVVPEADQDAALSLVMRIYAACGKPMPNASEFHGKEALMKEALRRTKRSTQDEIKWVLEYVMTHPRATKEPDVILRDFDSLLRFAIPCRLL